MSVSDTRELLAGLCHDTAASLSDAGIRTAVEAVAHKLDEPLQVTVAGGVSSGKSTLVNALLGQRIAAVDAGECTKVVTRFRYSHHERVEVVRRDGSRRTLGLIDGALPAELGVPIDEVRYLDVHLSNAGLRDVGIVDTPGMNTVTRANEDQSAGFLGLEATDAGGRATATAIGQADALVLLMPHLRQSDADVLGAFRRLYDGTGLSAFNAVAVLSKVDQLSRSGDPMDVAAPIVARVAQETRGLVSDVLPIIGLLAETASTARLLESDARTLAKLAAWGDDLDREDLLLSPQSFLDEPGPDVPTPDRRRLLDMAGLYGITLAMSAIDEGARGAAAILALFQQRSGFAPLRRVVMERLGAQARLIKAANAVADLRRLSYVAVSDPADAAALRALRSPLDRLELDPSLHHLRVVDVLADASGGGLALPDSLMIDVDRLVSGSDPWAQLGVNNRSDAISAAQAGAARWGRWGNDPRRHPFDARRARVIKTAYELLWSTLSSEEKATAAR